jgi:WXXGXW repeat (2 copies)
MKRLFTPLTIVAALGVSMLVLPMVSMAQDSIDVSVRVGPPEMPYYPQPPIPGDGYIWTPGYWGYSNAGYFWVPGTWVLAPAVGLLWTPGWWGWGGGYYAWHRGYWGPHVGYYGGINYGYGYNGHGYAGGYWQHGAFHYNRSVNNVNGANIHNTYSKAVVNDSRSSRISYNGGPNGINARPTSAEQAADRGHEIAPTGVQMQHEHAANSNPAQHVSSGHHMPEVAATPQPGRFSGSGVVHVNPANGSYEHAVNGNSANSKNRTKGEGAAQLAAQPNQKNQHKNKTDEDSRPPPG